MQIFNEILFYVNPSARLDLVRVTLRVTSYLVNKLRANLGTIVTRRLERYTHFAL